MRMVWDCDERCDVVWIEPCETFTTGKDCGSSDPDREFGGSTEQGYLRIVESWFIGSCLRHVRRNSHEDGKLLSGFCGPMLTVDLEDHEDERVEPIGAASQTTQGAPPPGEILEVMRQIAAANQKLHAAATNWRLQNAASNQTPQVAPEGLWRA